MERRRRSRSLPRVSGDGHADGTRASRSSAFSRMGAFAARHRWWVVGIWVAGLVAVFPLVGKLGDRLSNGGFEVPGSQSDRVLQATEEEFTGRFEFSDLLVLRSETLTAEDPEFRETFEDVREALLRSPGVGAVSDPYAAPEQAIGEQGHTLTASVGLTDDQDQALEHNAELQTAVADAAGGSEQIEAYLTGSAAFYDEFSRTTKHDLERAESIALPISLLILILAFGSLVAAGMPLAIALFSLVVSFGVISLVAANTTVNLFTQNIASMIGIGVGIDYSLFVVSRYRSELREGHDVPEAISRAMATSGKAVMVSGLTVVLALSGTLLVDIPAFRSMGLGAMIAVALAALAALTLLPALLGFVGRKVNSLHLGRKPRSEEEAATSRMWHRWAMAVMRRPWIALGGSLLLLGLLAFPARDLRLGSSGPSILPPESRPRQAIEVVAAAFGEGQVSPVQILVETGGDVLGESFPDVYEVAGAIAADPEVVRVDSIATLAPGAGLEEAQAIAASPEAAPFVETAVGSDGRATLLSAVTRHGPQSDEVGGFVDRIRERLPDVAPGLEIAVGGDAGLNVDINDEVTGKMIPVVAMVLILSFFLLMLFFRSILLPLKAILMNAASVLATYGILVFVFQQGHFEGLLGFEAAGHIESFLPLFLFTILFGLSMDYEVFLLARVREEYLRTGDNTEAVGSGLEHTAKIITSAAAIMVTVFGAFAFASLVPVKSMGFGLAAAVFLDATLVRIVLVPATMRLMGSWNWWLPSWLARILPNVSLEGVQEPELVPVRTAPDTPAPV